MQQARLERRYEAVREATLGIIFFGTPHRGSDEAGYGKVLADVAKSMTRKPPARLLSALWTQSDVLLQLTLEPKYQVVSFYEQPLKALSSPVKKSFLR